MGMEVGVLLAASASNAYVSHARMNARRGPLSVLPMRVRCEYCGNHQRQDIDRCYGCGANLKGKK